MAAPEVAEPMLKRQIRERHLADLPPRMGADYATAIREGRDLCTMDGHREVLGTVLKTLSDLDTADGQSGERAELRPHI